MPPRNVFLDVSVSPQTAANNANTSSGRIMVIRMLRISLLSGCLVSSFFPSRITVGKRTVTNTDKEQWIDQERKFVNPGIDSGSREAIGDSRFQISRGKNGTIQVKIITSWGKLFVCTPHKAELTVAVAVVTSKG